MRSLLNNQPAAAIQISRSPAPAPWKSRSGSAKPCRNSNVAFPKASAPDCLRPDHLRARLAAIGRHHLGEAILLVVLVVVLFLQSWRASLIPLAAVPASFIGTFAVMHLFGFLAEHALPLRTGALDRHRGG
jgi:hypothetical protein